MNLQKLSANIDYHERVAEATDDPVAAMKHYQATRLLRDILQPAALAHAQRQQFTETRNAASRTQHRR